MEGEEVAEDGCWLPEETWKEKEAGGMPGIMGNGGAGVVIEEEETRDGDEEKAEEPG